MPEDFHYAMKAVPTQWSREYCDEIVARVPREMTEKSVFAGSSDEVSDKIGAFVDAGATHVALWDFGPMVRPAEEAPLALGRSLELCRKLKARNAVTA